MPVPARHFFQTRLSLLLGLTLCLGSSPLKGADASTPLPTPGSIANALAEEVRGVFSRAREAVVKIEASDKAGQLCGTGFFIDPNGTILTSYSVGGEATEIIISHGEKKLHAKRLIADARSGIALLRLEKIDKPTPFLPLGKSGELTIATPVILVAFPIDMPIAPSFGMIAGFDLKYLNRYFATTHIRANVPVQRGEGGAPLLNMRGEVVGVVTSGLDGGASCFALPIEAATKVQRDYLRFGALRPGWLGVMVAEAPAPSPHGSVAQIDGLEEGGPANEAGLQKGDIILRIGESRIHAPQDVLNASFYLTAGEKIPVTLWRGEEEVSVDITPGERAAPAKTRPRSMSIFIGGDDITLRVDH